MIKDGRISNSSSTGSSANGAQIFLTPDTIQAWLTGQSNNHPLRIFDRQSGYFANIRAFQQKDRYDGKIVNYTRSGRQYIQLLN